jgi:L-alanine-DL-glutamate epimerase-like enolase superfamily enzyme
MNIKSIRAELRNLALRKPYTIANLTCSDVENVFLEIELSNGIIGLGAANPAPEVVGETPAQTLINCQSPAFEQLIGRDVRDFKILIAEIRAQFPQAPGTVAALDIALHDACGQLLNIPVVDFYGQKHQSLPTSVTIGIMPVRETLEEAAAFLSHGFRILKVKTGMDVAEDIDRILQLNDRFRDQITIRVDANQGYGPDELEQFLAATRYVPLELIEQPFPVGMEQALLDFPPAVRKILTADESLHGPDSARALAQSPQPYGIFNIKLMKCGGILGALEIADIAQPAGIDLFWGCNDESMVSITAALHAAFACPRTRYLDLDGSFDLAEDRVTCGFVVEDGWMRLSGGIGLGI